MNGGSWSCCVQQHTPAVENKSFVKSSAWCRTEVIKASDWHPVIMPTNSIPAWDLTTTQMDGTTTKNGSQPSKTTHKDTYDCDTA